MKKKQYIVPQQTCLPTEDELPILAASGGGSGGSSDPVNTGDPAIGGSGNNDGLPTEEGGARLYGSPDGFYDDF